MQGIQIMLRVQNIELLGSDVFCLKEVQEQFLLILSGYMLEITCNCYTYV